MTISLPAARPSPTCPDLGSSPGVNVRRFAGPAGTEYHLSVEAPAELDFSGQVAVIEARYAEALRRLGLDPATAIFRRIFLSDSANQVAALQTSSLVNDGPAGPVAVSVIQQPPLPGAKIALLAYHLDGGGSLAKTRLSPHQVLLDRNGRRHLWTTRLCAGGAIARADADAQTREVFDTLTGALGNLGANLRDHCVRTWIYVKDVDVFYRDVVKSRIAVFDEHGLTAETHYIASTGIEGACAHQFDVVVLDAYSMPDMEPAQMSFLNDLDYMCLTKDYNVTFERGTRIAYADRAHYFISGTASIDHTGAVLFTGDVIAQLDRALENVAAILRSGGADLADMMHWIVYLRDPSDHDRVRAHLEQRFPGLPTVIVRGPVCRPDWLIEIEGIAATPLSRPDLPGF